MKMVQRMVDELRYILKQKCNIDLPSEIVSLDQVREILPRLFFDAFLQNICVHLGHSKVGYWCERLPDEQLVIHYGSSLRYLGSTPQCVIYEKTHKTSQHFMLQALPVHEEWIQDTIRKGQLKCHPAESSLFKYHQVHTLSFDKIGPSLSLKLAHKFSSRGKLVPEFCHFEIPPVFEQFKHHGIFQVYCQECYHDQVRKIVNDFIQTTKNELKVESCKYGILNDSDDVKIIVGVGGSIQHLLMPGDFQAISVRGLRDKFISDAKAELQSYGECAVHIKQEPYEHVLVEYQNSADASKALNHQFQSFSDPIVVVQQYSGQKRFNFYIKVEWNRRHRLDHAFIEFKNPHLFPHSNCIRDQQSELSFQFQHEKSSIKVTGIWPDTTEKYIKSRLIACVPQIERAEFKLKMLYEKVFKESDINYTLVKRHLLKRLAQHSLQSKCYVKFIRPNPKTIKYKAFVYCDDLTTLNAAVIGLQDVEKDWNRYIYRCNMIFSSVLYAPQVFPMIKNCIQELFSTLQKLVEISYRKNKWGNRFFIISSCNNDTFMEVKKMLSSAIEPDYISFSGDKENMYISTVHFMDRAKVIQEKTHTYIKIDTSVNNKSIFIYGTRKQREAAKREIQMHVQTVMQEGTHCFEINLKEYKPGLMKDLVMKYGTDLVGVSDSIEDIKATRLDPRRQILTLFTTEAVCHSFREVLSEFNPKDLIQQATVHDTMKENLIDERCCVCFKLHNSERQRTSFRLEYCGHVYCKECIELQLHSTSVTFPIVCAAENCREQLVWKDFKNLFHDKKERLREIISASLKSYVAANKTMTHNCITPGCEMIYLNSESSLKFVCGHCNAEVCTHCHTAWYVCACVCRVPHSAHSIQKPRSSAIRAPANENKEHPKRVSSIRVSTEDHNQLRVRARSQAPKDKGFKAENFEAVVNNESHEAYILLFIHHNNSYLLRTHLTV